MTISPGDRLPEATFLRMGASGPEEVALSDLIGRGKAVIFGLPGAFTGTCTTAHVPSFIRTRSAFAEKGVDSIVCVSVNDPWVTDAWGKATGATEAGIAIVADASGDYTRAIGMDFSYPPAGFHGRSLRYSMYVEDGVVKVLNAGDKPGHCEIAAGETLLEQI